MNDLQSATRNIFFTGKGGVGKTSVACATAVTLADSGKRVLLVSTDPASNLNEVLGVALGNHPTQVDSLPNLWAMNLDPEQSAAEYRERMVSPYRGILPDEALASMEEQFSGSCTLEIAAFDEFSRLLGDPEATSRFEHVVFDTAPTGHTLRLLTLPSAWSGFMEQNTTGTSCLGPLAGLQAQQQLYQQTVKSLSNAATTTLILVARPESSALTEAARTSDELAALGVENQHVVINGVFSAEDRNDPYAVALENRGDKALQQMPEALAWRPQTRVPLRADGVIGLAALRDLLTAGERVIESHASENTIGEVESELPSLASVVDKIAASGHGVVLTMGKGGVGKTTVAAAIAVALAERGYDVQLSTTDPAAHLDSTLGADSLPNLAVSRIDPIAETEKYATEVLSRAGANLDAPGKALLEEDLRSPCTEEIAVFRAFADAVAEGTNRFVVLDTAPTGHTILLLDSALAYHREVSRQSHEMPEAVQQLLPRLRDQAFTHVLLVTLAESTPVHEAAALQRDLRRADIEPFAWVVNQVLSSLPVTDPILRQRQIHERKFLEEVQSVHSARAVFIPWCIEPPTGHAALGRLSLPVR
jgi:arsenite-transporting ATPase